jgi:hypothetical protein
MGGIKYYQLAEDEEIPDEFCVVRDVDGEPSEYMFYVPEVENAKLRELVRDYEHCSMHADCGRCEYDGTTSTHCPLSPYFPDIDELHELGVEVDG